MSAQRRDPGSFVREVAESTRQHLQELREQHDELRSENRRLREVVEEQRALVAELTEEARRAREERAELERQLESARGASRGLGDRSMQLERQMSQLASLYVASYRLHETLERREILAVVQEIVVNLVGSEELAIFELDPQRPELVLAASMGVDEERWRRVALGEGPVGSRAAAAEIFLAPEDGAGPPDLTALVPLLAGGRLDGAIAIFRLLGHKPRLEPCDREMLSLLATHAGHALYLARLHAQAAAARAAVA